MSQDIIIAFDVMGGDQGSRPCVLAAKKFAETYPCCRLLLFGDETELSRLFDNNIPSNITIKPSTSVVTVDDSAAHALREKQDSSMALALQAVAGGDADACVSGGNTGALLALGRHFVKSVPGLKRPAICRAIPTRRGASYMLDLGANLNCSAESLFQFGLMGVALARVSGTACPKVAILNVGSEMSKGDESLKQASRMLGQEQEQGAYQFAGFVEGDEMFSGAVDVIVCDGFSGNVALKVSEGLVKHLIASLDAFFSESILGRVTKLIAGPMLKSWSRKKNPSLYNGAAFLGLRKTVIKSHGAADELGVFKALEAAREQVQSGISEKISAYFSSYPSNSK